MPLCLDEGLRNWQQEQSAITGCEITGQLFNIIDPRQRNWLLTKPSLWFRALCAMTAKASKIRLCLSAFFLRLVPASSPLHLSWELVSPVISSDMTLKRLLVFFFLLPFFPLFSERHLLPSLILNPIPVSAFYSVISCLNGRFPSLWVCIGNVETNWNRLELKSSETITYYH